VKLMAFHCSVHATTSLNKTSARANGLRQIGTDRFRKTPDHTELKETIKFCSNLLI